MEALSALGAKIVPVIVLLLLGTPNEAGINYIPITDWLGPIPPAVQSKPAYLAEVTDTVFNTRFRRMTNDGDRGYYSLRPVFNLDSSKFLLNSGKIRQVADGGLVGTTYELSGNQPFRNPVWSKVDADILYGTIGLKFVKLNVSTEVVTTIRDMGVEDSFTSNDSHIYMDNLQSISGADQYIVLTDVTRGGQKIVVVNIQTGGRHAWIQDAFNHPNFTVRTDQGDPNARMNIGISPLGNYIFLVGENKLHLFDHNLTYIRELASHGHADFGIDTNGNEVLVSICPAKYEILSTGTVIDLLSAESYACGHLNGSANYQQPGWAYLSVIRDDNDDGANGNTQGFEIVAVQLDGAPGTNVRRVVHPRNTGGSNETAAFGVPNPDGSLLMFNSSWDNAGPVEAYIVELTQNTP